MVSDRFTTVEERERTLTYQRNETPEPLASDQSSAFEALMPEPAEYACIGGVAQNVYTADQLRTAMQAVWDAATERAAKLCDEQGDFYVQQAREGDQSGASDHKACAAVECADAIRSAP